MFFESFRKKKEEKPEVKIEKSKYNFEEIKELEKPIIALVEQLKEKIDKGEYDTLISDDVSGRIPTLIFKEIMQNRLRRLNSDLRSEEEREKLKTYFISGGRAYSRAYSKEALTEFFKKIKPDIKRKALLVTEFISSGESLHQIGNLLDKENIPFDIAAVFASNKVSYYKKYIFQLQDLFIGQIRKLSPAIWCMEEKKGFTGVEKIENQYEAHPKARREKIKNAEKAREDVSKMAETVVKEVWEE